MIPVKNDVLVRDTLPGWTVKADIGDPRMVMKSLTDLYSNQALAVIREYSTNARDSHILAGKADVPIEITLPEALNPYFIVRDYGVGLSADELRDVYVSYGTSTKRDSDDFNGVLGFGSKSALTYTNSFTITAVKDGIESLAVVTRHADYSVVLKLVMSRATSRPNGVEIKIPVDAADSNFVTYAQDFYKFWEPGTVLVNGEQPIPFAQNHIIDDIYRSASNNSYIVMSGVAYRINNPGVLFTKCAYIPFVAYVKNGEVDFPPSREDLKYTERTRTAIIGIGQRIERALIARAAQDIDTAPSHAEAYLKWRAWMNELGGSLSGLTFRGDTMVNRFEISAKRYGLQESQANLYTVAYWWMDKMERSLILTHAPANITSHTKGVARRIASRFDDENDLRFTGRLKFILFVEGDFDSKWISPERIIDWNVAKATLPRLARKQVNRRPAGTFEVWDTHGCNLAADLPAGPWYWISTRQRDTHSIRNIQSSLNDWTPTVVLGANRIDAFRRKYPNARNLIDHLRSHVHPEPLKLIPERTHIAATTSYSDLNVLNRIDIKRVDDPMFAVLRDAVDNRTQDMVTFNQQMQLRKLLKDSVITPNYKAKSRITMAYPLLGDITLTKPYSDDAYLYINTVYATRQGIKI